MSKIKTSERTTDIVTLARIECSRMRKEGFKIPTDHWKYIELDPVMDRKDIRFALAEGQEYYFHGALLTGEQALAIMSNTHSKRMRGE